MAGILFNEEISDAGSLAESCVFHRTSKEEARNILQSGFEPSQGEKSSKADEQFVKSVSDAENISKSIDRTETSFFYPFFEQIEGDFGGRLGTCAIVVDISKISEPMWVADMDAYDTVISWTPMDDERARNGPYDDDETKAVVSYMNTVESVSTTSQALKEARRKTNPELLIQGRVPTTAIVGVLLD